MKTKDCSPVENMAWEDCDKTGHEIGCYVLVCPDCHERFYDCEDVA